MDENKNGSGTSWADAFKYLQDALNIAELGDQIWVADGTYYPSYLADPTDSRSATFLMLEGVKLYGGFVGVNCVTVIAAGGSHNLAIKTDGSVAAWGDNSEGQCNPSGTGFVAIAAGGSHSIALKTDGSLAAWGANDYGQCDVPSGTDFTAAIAGGWHFSLAIKSDGSIVHWGPNCYGVGDVPSGNDFVAIGAGDCHCVALKSDGSIVSWGRDYEGLATPPEGNDFVAIAAGKYHCVALKADGSLIAWGWNAHGQCNVPAGNDFVAIAAGDYHDVAIKADGSLVAWGRNDLGQCDVPSVYYGETSRDERDWEKNETILSGDIDKNGQDADNSYNIIKVNNVTDVVLDGFTIKGGYANRTPGYIVGGGMDIDGSSLTVKNCTFINNFAWYGGGVYSDSSSSEFIECIFSGNTASNEGGGMRHFKSSTKVVDCIFTENSDSGITNFESSLEVINSVFTGNPDDGLLLAFCYESPFAKVINCTFYGNGRGLRNHTSESVTVANCIFWNNGEEISINNPPEMPGPIFINCDMEGCGGSPDTGGTWNWGNDIDGGGNIDADPRFVNSVEPEIAVSDHSRSAFFCDMPVVPVAVTLQMPSIDGSKTK
ncbi:hypothetical protein ES705_38634 [subsurface metagenome]